MPVHKGRSGAQTKIRKLNFQPPDTLLNTPSVSQGGREKGSYIMTLDAGFSSRGGRGTGVVVALHTVPAVSLNLLQGKGSTRIQAQHTHTHFTD